ncbi:MAG: hypothetical protein E7049_06200 [Lentisphaerae bacterium]|nr:hypothetical protein [Lentisphaerota bacterium]
MPLYTVPFIAMLAALTSPSDFRSLTRTEASSAVPVSVTGVVTLVSSGQKNSALLADVADPNGAAVYFDAPNAPDAGMKPGDIVAVSGNVAPMAYAPGIFADRIVRLGAMTLPPVDETSFGDFFAKRNENRRAKVRGTLNAVLPLAYQEWEEVRNSVLLRLDVGDGCIDAKVPGSVEEWLPFVDSELELTGVRTAFFNGRAQFITMHLNVSDKEDCKVLRPPPDDPFSAPMCKMADILSFTPSESLPHAVHVAGVVTYVSPAGGFFFVQNGDGGVKVITADGSLPRHGATVDVVGFPRIVGGIGRIVDGRFRESDGHGLMEVSPVVRRALDVLNYNWNDERKLYEEHDGLLVSTKGRFESFCDEGFVMKDGDFSFEVCLEGARKGLLADADFTKPMLNVTGVANLELDLSGAASIIPKVLKLTIYVQDSNDIHILPDAGYRMRNAELFLFAVLKVMAAVLVLLAMLLLVRFLRAEREKGRLAAVVNERKRMAADLHDTIEQHLACAHIVLDGAERSFDTRPNQARKAIAVAKEVLSRAKTETRNTIMNLRDDDILSTNLASLLKRLAKEISVSGLVSVRTALRGIPLGLSAASKLDILAIVREALTNAAKHGHAKNAAVVSDPLPLRGFSITIANDGKPFDRNAAPGPTEGHFGLSGMSERAVRIGGTISFGQKGDWTYVKLEVFQ